ncbi:prophage tail fiber N-terminal domain-containing protein [Serratia sp. PL7]|uniref:prophage tail fiber N-terminal domain-containing protein n=1 Tax=Serratia sp. PL7 TaxID=2952201 RepID=UPI0021AE27D1|nr:prophage tail fiber N-terminal domain-containing protein [Serratia sp. PL7]
MAVISGVLKGPMGDARVGVVIELRAVQTSATVVIQARSQSVTDATGRYTLSVEPGQYDVMITAAGRQPERIGGIQVMVNSSTGTLNDFLTIPGETDLNPAIVATVDQMRADTAVSAAASKASADTAAAILSNTLQKGDYGIGGLGGVRVDATLAETLAWAKNPATGSQIFRNDRTGSGLKLYGASMLMKAKDTYSIWSATQAGAAGDGERSGVSVTVGATTSDANNTTFEIWTDKNLPTPLKPGDYGLGTSYPIPSTDPDADRTNQFFRWAVGVSGTPGATQSWAGVQGGYDTNARWQLAWSQGSTGFDLATRVRATAGAWSPVWAKIWHTTNTTVDANGFIKKASPIVKLFGDGQCELNDESQGVTTERVSEGVYRISGTLGFNADAEWGGVDGGIEIPTDRNKLPLVWVDYEVDETGDLLIKTFHRVNATAPKFAQNVKVGYKEGQPIDIPAGRWIDLRVEMPGSDEPEYEPVPEDEVPEVTPEVTELEGGEESAPGETPAAIEEPKE